MNYHDEMIVQAISGHCMPDQLEITPSSDHLFDALSHHFPVAGSKIAWSSMADAVVISMDDLSPEEVLPCIEGLFMDRGLSGMATYAGDSLSEISVRCDLSILLKALPKIGEIPQHHYIVADASRWCLSITMERDICLGFRPRGTT